MEPSTLWSILLVQNQRFPGLFSALCLAALVIPPVLWGLFLVGFRQRGYRFGVHVSHPFLLADGTPLRRRLSASLRAGLRFPPLVLHFLPSLSRLAATVHDRVTFGFGPSYSFFLFLLVTAYTVGLALALLAVHWQEFSLALQSQSYLHWDWSNPRAANRTDLEYRWWLKWFWRQSTLGSGYFRGAVRLGRAGPGPRLHRKWKRPPRNLGYWLGVWRYRTPHRPFPDRIRRVRGLLGRRRPLRLLRWLLGLVVGLLMLQAWALVALLVEAPALVARTARHPPRIGSNRGRQFASELERFRDAGRRANWVGLLLLGLSLLIFFSGPPLPFTP